MSWVCSCCSNSNADTDATCLLCGTARPAVASGASETVCTLTQKRATELCSYEDVTVPSEFNVIGENAFKGRTNLYSVRIHSGVTKIMKSAFEGCTNLSRVYCDGELTSIGSRAFANCKYLSPDKRPTATRVSSDAFVGCSDKPIAPPDRVVGAKPAAKPTGSSTASRASSTASRTYTGFGTTEFKKSTSGSTSRTSSTGASTARSTTTTRASTSTGSYSPTTRTSSYTGGYRPAPTSTVSSTRRTSTAPTYSHAPVAHGGFLQDSAPWFIPFTVIFVIAVFIFCEWGEVSDWTDWSYMLGLSAALALPMLYRFFNEREDYNVDCWIGTALLVAVALLNWLGGADLLPITTVLTLTLTLIHLFGAIACFNEVEEGFGAWHVILSILNAALLIYSMIDNSYVMDWELWQTLIAVLISVSMAAGTYYSLDDFEYENTIGMQIIGFVITACLLWWFGDACATWITVMSASMIVTGVVSSVTCISDDDGGFGAAHIVFTSLSAVLLVLTHLIEA